MIYLLAVLIGVIAGLRPMTALAALAWAVHLGRLDLSRTWLGFLGATAMVWFFTALALAELVTDQLPATQSRKAPIPYAVRLWSGAFCGAAIGIAIDSWFAGFVAGGLGAALGTLAGSAARERLAALLHRDRPAALLEDLVDVGGAALIVAALT